MHASYLWPAWLSHHFPVLRAKSLGGAEANGCHCSSSIATIQIGCPWWSNSSSVYQTKLFKSGQFFSFSGNNNNKWFWRFCWSRPQRRRSFSLRQYQNRIQVIVIIGMSPASAKRKASKSLVSGLVFLSTARLQSMRKPMLKFSWQFDDVLRMPLPSPSLTVSRCIKHHLWSPSDERHLNDGSLVQGLQTILDCDRIMVLAQAWGDNSDRFRRSLCKSIVRLKWCAGKTFVANKSLRKLRSGRNCWIRSTRRIASHLVQKVLEMVISLLMSLQEVWISIVICALKLSAWLNHIAKMKYESQGERERRFSQHVGNCWRLTWNRRIIQSCQAVNYFYCTWKLQNTIFYSTWCSSSSYLWQVIQSWSRERGCFSWSLWVEPLQRR